MFRLRKDEDVHARVDGTVLHLRRTSKDALRWEHEVDLATIYAERFTSPIGHVIDGWFGAARELRLIVHLREANGRLLPPRELIFAAEGPRLERVRPGAQRRTLASKPLRTHSWNGLELQLVQELDDHVLAIIPVGEAQRLGWSIADLPEIGYRWFARGEIGDLPLVDFGPRCERCDNVRGEATEHRRGMNPISLDRSGATSRGIVECSTCFRCWQVDEEIEPGTNATLWKWTAIDGRTRAPTIVAAPEPTPEPAPVVARVAAAPRPEPSAFDRELERHVGIELSTVPGRSIRIDSETADTFRLCEDLATHDEALVAAGFAVESWQEVDKYNVVRGGNIYRLELSKRDPRLLGRFGRHRGSIVRVIDERPDDVLAIAHEPLAEQLEFTPARGVHYRWVARSQIDLSQGAQPQPPPEAVFQNTANEARVHDHIEIELAGLDQRLIVDAETADTITLYASLDDSSSELTRLGFSVVRTEFQDRYDLFISYDHRLEVRKDDPRLRGDFTWRPYRGALVRVIDDRGAQVLAVAHAGFGEQIGFDANRDTRIRQRWISRAELDDAPSPAATVPPPVVEPTRNFDPFDLTGSERVVHGHVMIGFAPLGERLSVMNETADTIRISDTLSYESSRFVKSGFSVEEYRWNDRDGEVVEYIHTLTVPKNDPRLTGAFTWRTYRGAKVRVVDERTDAVLAIAHPSLGEQLAFGASHDARLRQRWIARDELQDPGDDAWPPDAPPLDAKLRRQIAASRLLVFRGRTLKVTGETVDSVTLETGVLAFKGDAELAGPHSHVVRAGDHLLRVVAESGSHVLAVAHPELAAELGMRILDDSEHQQAIRWLRRADVELVASVATPAPTRELVAEDWLAARVGGLDRELSSTNETDDTIYFWIATPAADSLLTDLGFEHADRDNQGANYYLHLPKSDVGVWGQNLRARVDELFDTISIASVSHDVELETPDALVVVDRAGQRRTVAKTDPTVRGFQRVVEVDGFQLRVVDDGKHVVLAIASLPLASRLGFQRAARVAYGWVPHARYAAAMSRPYLLDPPTIAALHSHLTISFAGKTMQIESEAADVIILEGGLRLLKPDPRLQGAVSWARYNTNVLRIAQDQGDHLLAVAHPSLRARLPLVDIGADPIAAGWISRADAPAVEITSAEADRILAARDHADAQLAAWKTLELEVERVATPVTLVRELAEHLEIEGHGQIHKLDPRLGGGFLRIAQLGKHLVRIAAERDDDVLVIENNPPVTRWLPRFEIQMPAVPHDVLYRCLRVIHADHDVLFVTDETADSFITETMTIAKTDPRLLGPYGRIVLLRGNLLRVGLELKNLFLVIAAEPLARTLGFTIWSYDQRSLGYKWFLPAELDEV